MTIKTHAPGINFKSACGTSGLRTSQNVAEVTCNRCVFALLVRGDIKADDPRVTEPMRKRGGF